MYPGISGVLVNGFLLMTLHWRSAARAAREAIWSTKVSWGAGQQMQDQGGWTQRVRVTTQKVRVTTHRAPGRAAPAN